MIASLRESARLASTHHSTAIEGNRLSLVEIAEVIKGGGMNLKLGIIIELFSFWKYVLRGSQTYRSISCKLRTKAYILFMKVFYSYEGYFMKNMTFGRYLYVLLISAFIANTFDLSHAYAMKRGADEEGVQAEEALRTVKRKRTYEVRNPLYDTLFKKVFKTPECIIDLLNSVFDLQGEDRVASVEYLSEEFPSEVVEGGTLIFDIHCKTSKGDAFIVEMQKGLIQGMTKRLELYSATALKHQWDLYSAAVREKGQKLEHYRKYGQLRPVRTLAFLDYTDPVFKNNPGRFFHKYQILHTETHRNDLPLQQWMLVDLISLREALAQGQPISGISENSIGWLRFLTRLDHERVEVEGADKDPLVIAYRAVSELTEEEQRRVTAEDKALTDLHAHYDAASTVGLLQGLLSLFDKGKLDESDFLGESKGVSIEQARAMIGQREQTLPQDQK